MKLTPGKLYKLLEDVPASINNKNNSPDFNVYRNSIILFLKKEPYKPYEKFVHISFIFENKILYFLLYEFNMRYYFKKLW